MKMPRLSPETLRILDEFIERPTDWRYGYELSRETGLKSGTLYPILMRLEKCKFLEARWVAAGEGVPPRHTYRLTPNGLDWVRARLAEARRSPISHLDRSFRGPAFSAGPRNLLCFRRSETRTAALK
jgi:PadR family transcriptional regulator